MKNERRKYMNNSKQDILNNLIKEPFINQRILAAQTGHSLGIVNRSIKELISEGYLDEEIRPTERHCVKQKKKRRKTPLFLPPDLVCGWFRLIQRHRKDFWKSKESG